MVSAASSEQRFGPDDPNYFIYNYALENLVSEVLGQFGSVVTYHNSHNTLAVLLPLQKMRTRKSLCRSFSACARSCSASSP